MSFPFPFPFFAALSFSSSWYRSQASSPSSSLWCPGVSTSCVGGGFLLCFFFGGGGVHDGGIHGCRWNPMGSGCDWAGGCFGCAGGAFGRRYILIGGCQSSDKSRRFILCCESKKEGGSSRVRKTRALFCGRVCGKRRDKRNGGKREVNTKRK